MGCTGSVADKSEEQAIRIAEKALGLNRVEATRVDYLIRKFSFDQKLCQSHLERISASLPMQIKDYGVYNKISDFFSDWMDENDEIQMRELLLMGLLLSSGDPKTKARLIFQVSSRNKSLDISKAEDLIREIICLSLRMGNLVSDDQNSFSNEIKNRQYIADLSKVKEEAIQKVTKAFGANQDINEDSFVEVLGDDDGKLVSATGWRMMLNSIAIVNSLNR